MNTFTRILTGMKGVSAARAWQTCACMPAMILFWFQLRKLTAALDALFNAWRSGTLPANTPRPQPQAAAASPAQDTPQIPAAVLPRAEAAPSRITGAKPRQPRTPVTGAAAQPAPRRAPRTALPSHPRPNAHPFHPWNSFAPPAPLSKNCDNLDAVRTHVHIVPIAK